MWYWLDTTFTFSHNSQTREWVELSPLKDNSRKEIFFAKKILSRYPIHRFSIKMYFLFYAGIIFISKYFISCLHFQSYNRIDILCANFFYKNALNSFSSFPCGGKVRNTFIYKLQVLQIMSWPRYSCLFLKVWKTFAFVCHVQHILIVYLQLWHDDSMLLF